MANTTPVAEEGKSLSACVSGTPSGVISGQGRRGDPLKVRGRVCYQANRRSEALSRQRDARRDLNNHIRRVAVEALAQDAEAEDMEAVDQRACVEEDLHVDKAWHRPRSHAGNTESARSFYARQLMQPEWLNDVPGDLASHWYALPRPEGQRCLVVASEGCTVSRTRAGRLLHTFPSALPGGARGGDAGAGGPCILDCVFHEPAGTYFVQDLMCWKGYALYDCSAEFRLFWLHTKLAECGASSARGKRHRYPFVPLTAFACDPGGLRAALRDPVPFVRDGATLLHKEGYYELGASPLALLWKDATCSRYHLDTDAAGVLQAQQTVTLQCLPCGELRTSDEPPHVLARLPDVAAQQLGERARPGRLLRFTILGGGLQLGPDGCPLSADLHFEGPANHRRGKADTLSKVLFQYRARRQPDVTLEALLEEGSGDAPQSLCMSQDVCQPPVGGSVPAEAMALDAM